MYYIKKKKSKTKDVTFPKDKPKKQSIPTLVRKLDEVFSKYIRLRDSRPFGYKAFRCISCGQVKPYDQMDCGHFIGRKNMATRFDENNCHGECRSCNRFSADHMIYYQRNLEQKIGVDKVDMIVARGHSTKKWTSWELEILITHYKEEVKRMEAERDGKILR